MPGSQCDLNTGFSPWKQGFETWKGQWKDGQGKGRDLKTQPTHSSATALVKRPLIHQPWSISIRFTCRKRTLIARYIGCNWQFNWLFAFKQTKVVVISTGIIYTYTIFVRINSENFVHAETSLVLYTWRTVIKKTRKWKSMEKKNKKLDALSNRNETNRLFPNIQRSKWKPNVVKCYSHSHKLIDGSETWTLSKKIQALGKKKKRIYVYKRRTFLL